MLYILVIIVLAIISIVSSVLIEGVRFRGLCNATFLLLIAVMISAYFHYYGVFGNPLSLKRGNHYHQVLSVRPLGDSSSAVILRNESGEIVPIIFYTLVPADANGLYTIEGSSFDTCKLVPIK